MTAGNVCTDDGSLLIPAALLCTVGDACADDVLILTFVSPLCTAGDACADDVLILTFVSPLCTAGDACADDVWAQHGRAVARGGGQVEVHRLPECGCRHCVMSYSQPVWTNSILVETWAGAEVKQMCGQLKNLTYTRRCLEVECAITLGPAVVSSRVSGQLAVCQCWCWCLS